MPATLPCCRAHGALPHPPWEQAMPATLPRKKPGVPVDQNTLESKPALTSPL